MNEAREKNEQAMAYLTISILSHDLIAFTKGCSDIGWPDGKVWKVWQVLKERAQPTRLPKFNLGWNIIRLG